MKKKKKKVPKGWMDCPSVSLQIICDKFVAFKTPLDYKYDNKVPVSNAFDVEMFFSSMASKNVSA